MISKIFGFAILGSALAVVFIFEGKAGNGFVLLHWPALVLTGIGPMGLVMISSDWTSIKQTLSLLRNVGLRVRVREYEMDAHLFPKLSREHYGRGISPEGLSGISSFLRRAIRRLNLKVPVQDVKDTAEWERERQMSRVHQCAELAQLGVRFTPSIGMLGTILGMVNLLGNMKDPALIGSAMSLALLTTFYGLFFSLVLWTPLHNWFERMREVETEGMDHVVRWLTLLENRKSPQYMEIENLDSREKGGQSVAHQ